MKIMICALRACSWLRCVDSPLRHRILAFHILTAQRASSAVRPDSPSSNSMTCALAHPHAVPRRHSELPRLSGQDKATNGRGMAHEKWHMAETIPCIALPWTHDPLELVLPATGGFAAAASKPFFKPAAILGLLPSTQGCCGAAFDSSGCIMRRRTGCFAAARATCLAPRDGRPAAGIMIMPGLPAGRRQGCCCDGDTGGVGWAARMHRGGEAGAMHGGGARGAGLARANAGCARRSPGLRALTSCI